MGIVEGETAADAQKAQANLNKTFADKKFDSFRSNLTIGKDGKTFNSISSDALSSALKDNNLSADDKALISQVSGAINSTEVHKVEYADASGSVSTEGSGFIKDAINSKSPGVGNSILKPDGTMSSSLVNALGGGALTVKTSNGSYSVLLQGSGVTYPSGGNEATTLGHEVFGHGIPSASGATPAANNTNAIRMENLFRRVMGISTQRDGSDHGGGIVPNPTALPVEKDK